MKPPTSMVEEIPGLRGLVVRRLLEAPDTPVAEIRRLALSRYPDVSKLSVREFGARYVRPLRRRMREAPVRRPRSSAESRPSEAVPREPQRDSSGLPLLDAAISESRDSLRASKPAAPDRFDRNGSVELGASPTSEEPASPLPEARGEGHSPTGVAAPRVAPDTGPPGPDEDESDDLVRELRLIFFRLAYEMSIEDSDVWLVETVAGLDRYVQEAARVLTRGRPTVATGRR